MKNIYDKYIMARKTKYRAVVLKLLTDKPISTNQVLKNAKKKTGKSVHWYLIDRVLNDLLNENKIEKSVLTFGKQNIFMWRLKKRGD